MTENPILLVGALLALLLAAALLVWGVFALRARARRRTDAAIADAGAESARRVGAPAFAPLPSEEVPARIPFGTAESSAPAGGPVEELPSPAADAPLPHAEIVAADVPRAAISYTPALLESAGPAGGPAPAPIEMPEELSVRIGPPAGAQRAALPLIDAVPDFSAPAAPAPAVPSALQDPVPASGPASEMHAALSVDPLDATIITGRRNSAWVFESESGQRVPLSAAVVLLGRNPSHLPGHEDAQLVTVRDAGRTVSKTHVMLHRHEDSWRITDLDSTNGVYLLGADGEETELEPGTPARITDRFILGEMSARIFQEE
ncbi:FHA domain-containing protein [Microterricola viridarii]|uniref:FHA domain-containing protein n=1 Tax=Microterricola viridarii TaxID=412690 RepID=A0A1H1PUP4_9MICO|nr:FHA domain-containing protein [Microterricola viridarii]SDS15081.1 FHA domain-containing protein [Microterricola viridarii]